MSTINLILKLDAADAQKAIQTLSGNISSLEGGVKRASGSLFTFDDIATKIGFRLQGISNIFSAFSGTFGAWITESNAGEAATAKLTRALQNQGHYSRELVDELIAYAAARQQATGIDDDATISIAAQLTAMGLQGQALKDAIVATQDLATLMDGDMQAAVRVVADAFSGNVGMLSRYIKGLDEADIKQRGMQSIIEQLNRAVGGQAEAFGETGAGAIKRYDAAISDLKQSFGDLLKEGLIPLISNFALPALQFFNEAGPAARTAALGITTLGIAFAFVNTQIGYLPYAIVLTATGLVTLYQAVRDNTSSIVVMGTSIALLTAGIMVFNLTGLSPTILSMWRFIASLPAAITGLWGLMHAAFGASGGLAALGAGLAVMNALLSASILAGLAAIGLAIAAWVDSNQELENSINAIKKSYNAMTKEIIDEIDRMPSLQEKLKLSDYYIADIKARAQRLFDDLEAMRARGDDDDEVTKQEARLNAEIERLKAIEQKKVEMKRNYRAKLSEEEKKDAAKRAEAEFELQKKTIELMENGYTKRAAMAQFDYEHELALLKKRLNDREISERQYTELVRIEQTKRDRILHPEIKPMKLKSYSEALTDETEKEKRALDTRVKQTEGAFKKIDQSIIDNAQTQVDASNKNREAADAAMKAMQEQVEQNILAGAQQYDAAVNLGVQMNQVVNQSIRRIIAEAVATQIAKVLSFLPFPINVPVAAAAGVAVQALIEKAIPKFAYGGVVPGVGNEDNVLALLTPGERVMRKSVSLTHGAFLDALNAGIAVPAQQVVMQINNDNSRLENIMRGMSKQIKKLKLQVNLQSFFDIQKFQEAQNKSARAKAAVAL